MNTAMEADPYKEPKQDIVKHLTNMLPPDRSTEHKEMPG